MDQGKSKRSYGVVRVIALTHHRAGYDPESKMSLQCAYRAVELYQPCSPKDSERLVLPPEHPQHSRLLYCMLARLRTLDPDADTDADAANLAPLRKDLLGHLLRCGRHC